MKKRGTVMRMAILFGWLLGILLPMFSFRRLSPSYRAVFDWVFQTHASHVLMHTFLYAVLVVVLLGIGAVAVLQEVFQLVAERLPLNSDAVFDVVVDLNGGLLGVLVYLKTLHRKRKKGPLNTLKDAKEE